MSLAPYKLHDAIDFLAGSPKACPRPPTSCFHQPAFIKL